MSRRCRLQSWRGKRKRIAAWILTAVLIFPGMLQFPGTLLALADEKLAEGSFSFEDDDGISDERLLRELGGDGEEAEKHRGKNSVKSAERMGATASNAAGTAAASPAEAATTADAAAKSADVETAGPVWEATPSAALLAIRNISSLGDLWDDWEGDFSFLDGRTGDGSEKKPYQIRNKSQLMGLSQLVAMGMCVQPGEGDMEIVGSYDGKHFKLMSSIDLDGMEWNPVGYYRDSSEYSGEITNKFFGCFDGNGKTISNFRLSDTSADQVGFFGAIEDGRIENLTLKPGKTICGKNNVAILAGSAVNSKLYNCTVSGSVQAFGTAGGIVGEAEGGSLGKAGMVIENCTANVTLNSQGSSRMYVGGIAGKAAGASIVDCRVETGDNNTARIQGREATVGGITGLQNDTDIYNCYVSGTIGGVGSLAVGGVTGRYASGHLKVARFEGIIGQSGVGAAGRRGTFIGGREAGDYFRYGEDVAYLFADTESKIAANVCGSEIVDDNEYTYGAHIGYSHKGDNFFTLVQGGKSRDSSGQYYYEELENGILNVIDEDGKGTDAEEAGYEIDHFAPNDAGRPTRGYLIMIPQIDTVSAGSNYYDVAALEARGNSGYYRGIDKEHRGAVAYGKSVTVSTSPNNTEEAKFQMEGVPTYTKGGTVHDTAYIAGGEYTFTMPAENTEVRSIYKKVAVKTSVIPNSYHISVVEERAGNRKSPVKTTKVLNDEGKLIATYINGALEKGTQVQPVLIQAVVDVNNDVADSSVKWSVDDPELIHLTQNDDEDARGYTNKSASISVNLDASFFRDTIRELERVQAGQNYQYPIPDTIYGAGHQNGGVAILTANTRPSASFEGKPCTANSRLNVTFQIKDKTYVANEGAVLDKPDLSFTVTRILAGNRKTPDESIQVTPPQALSAEFHPDFFDKKDITWRVNDISLIQVNGENRSASVTARADAKWIRDIIAADTGIHANDPYAQLGGTGSKTASVTVAAEDMLGNRQTAECPVSIQFVTDDRTRIYVEDVVGSPKELDYKLSCTKTGNRSNPAVVWEGTETKKLTAEILPKQAFNKTVKWQVSDDALSVDNGLVTVNTGAKWIQEVNRSSPCAGGHVTTVTAVTEDGNLKAVTTVRLTYQMKDDTYVSGGSSHGSGGGKGSGGKGGGGSGTASGTGAAQGTGPGALEINSTNAAIGAVTGDWNSTSDGFWTFTSGGKTYVNEWAYIRNPYARENQNCEDWFRFDTAGHMVTGWFTDEKQDLYYLSPASDGSKGHMTTGWQWIAGADGRKRCYYFNPLSDGARGAVYRSRTAPDGRTVNENGEWTVDGVVQAEG